MSMLSTVQVSCPSCGRQFEANQWQSLNADLNPDEKIQLLNRTLFKITCPDCGEGFNLVYPILYHDMKNKVMIQLVLDEENVEEFIHSLESMKNMEEWDSAVADGYAYRCVTNQIELWEKAMIFDCGLDDRAIEFLKLLYFVSINEQKLDLVVSDILFCHDTIHKLIIFTEGKPVFDIELDMKKYNDIVERMQIEFEDKSKDCLFINLEWALSVLQVE